MLLEILYTIVGDWGRALITWALNHQAVVAMFFLIWAVVLFSGKAQLRRLQRNTVVLVTERALQLTAEGKPLRIQEFYNQVYPEWTQMVRRTALFIPHHWELWPLPALPSVVRSRIGFTPEWVKQCLQKNDFKTQNTNGDQTRSHSLI
jgi:hypothetical protein